MTIDFPAAIEQNGGDMGNVANVDVEQSPGGNLIGAIIAKFSIAPPELVDSLASGQQLALDSTNRFPGTRNSPTRQAVFITKPAAIQGEATTQIGFSPDDFGVEVYDHSYGGGTERSSYSVVAGAAVLHESKYVGPSRDAADEGMVTERQPRVLRPEHVAEMVSWINSARLRVLTHHLPGILINGK